MLFNDTATFVLEAVLSERDEDENERVVVPYIPHQSFLVQELLFPFYIFSQGMGVWFSLNGISIFTSFTRLGCHVGDYVISPNLTPVSFGRICLL